jgi:hypothetical protein
MHGWDFAGCIAAQYVRSAQYVCPRAVNTPRAACIYAACRVRVHPLHAEVLVPMGAGRAWYMRAPSWRLSGIHRWPAPMGSSVAQWDSTIPLVTSRAMRTCRCTGRAHGGTEGALARAPLSSAMLPESDTVVWGHRCLRLGYHALGRYSVPHTLCSTLFPG